MREMKLEALRYAIVAGEKSGASTPFDLDAFIARKREEHRSGRKQVSATETKIE
jgi:antitoxin ParD1/3/4